MFVIEYSQKKDEFRIKAVKQMLMDNVDAAIQQDKHDFAVVGFAEDYELSQDFISHMKRMLK